VGALAAEEDGLYFTEGGVFSDGVSCVGETACFGAAYAVVRTELDGSQRRVLVSKSTPVGYLGIKVAGGYIIYAEQEGEGVRVGYVSKDGSAAGTFDLAPFGPKGAVLGYAALGYSGDVLVITADYYTDHAVHTLLISVDKDLHITLYDQTMKEKSGY